MSEIESTASKKKRHLERLSGKTLKSLRVRVTAESFEFEAPIGDFNAESIGIEVDDMTQGKLSVNSQVKLTISINGKVVVENETAQVVRSTETGKIGFSFAKHLDPRGLRGSERLTASSGFTPIVMGFHPLELSNVLNFKVIDFNGTGFRATTSLSNKNILPQMSVANAHIMLPGVGVEKIEFKLTRVAVKQDCIEVGAVFQNISKQTEQAIAQFALFGAENYTENIFELLKTAKLRPKDVSKAIRVKPIESMEDYVGVLKVRHEAYKEAKKVSDDSSHEEMADDFDNRSIILMAKVKGTVVATARLVECIADSDRFPFEQYIDFDDLDEKFDRKNYFELSRLAILPGLQGTNLIIRLFQEMARFTIIHKHAALCAATKATRQNYERIGCKKISGEAPYPTIEGESIAVFKVGSENFAKGKGLGGLAWYKAARPVIENLAALNYVAPPGSMPVKSILRVLETMVLKLTK